MKNMVKRLIISIVTFMFIFSFASTAFAADVGHVQKTIPTLHTVVETNWFTKSATTEKAVFNTLVYTTKEAGYVKCDNSALKKPTIQWGMDYRKNQNGSIGRALNYKIAYSSQRYTESLNPGVAGYQYRLRLYNSYANYDIKVKASYSAG